jgi:DNA-binding CsgD family transcriptional regulator
VKGPSQRLPGARRLTTVAAIVIVQALAAVFFLGNAVLDILVGLPAANSHYHGFELLVAIGLLAGVVMGALVLRQMLAEAKQRDQTMALARGAMVELASQRFAQWRLTDSEGEVALFALKGFDIAEIAILRKTAEGTVRAQLSRVYAKAGVTSQAMLIGSFIDEFLDIDPQPEAAPNQESVHATEH